MTEKIAIELQEKALVALSKNKGFRFIETFFPYTSGEIGPYYVQSGDIMRNAFDYKQAVLDMALAAKRIFWKDGTSEIVSGGETRDWIFSNPTAIQLGLPSAMLYKDGKIVGADIKGKKVLHIADSNNEGSSPRDHWIPIIRKNDGVINEILFYVDRLEDGVNVMQKLGLEAYAIAPLDEHAWDFLLKLKESGVTHEIYQQLRERGTTKEERDAWARAMLRSEKGLGRLAELFNDENSREKVKSMIVRGYADMTEEILDELRKRKKPGISVSEWFLGREFRKK